MHSWIIITALLYLLHFLSLHKSLFYPPFVYILYDECSEDVPGEYSLAKYNWGSTLGGIVPPSREKSPFLKRIEKWNFPLSFASVTEGVHWAQLHHPWVKSCPFWKEYKNEIFHLVMPYFNFWRAIEKCYYVSILADCLK